MKHLIIFVIVSLNILPNLVAQGNGNLPLLIPYREGNTWGYCDSNKKIIVKAQFDEPVLFYSNELVFVSINNKKGILDKTGVLLAKCEYDKFFYVNDSNFSYTLYAKKGKAHFKFNFETKTLSPYIFPNEDNNETNEVIEEIREDSYYFPPDSNINITLSSKNHYDIAIKKINHYTNKLLSIDTVQIIASKIRAIPMTDTLFFIKQNNKWGVISFTKKIIVPIIYDSIFGIFGGFAFGVQQGKKRGIIIHLPLESQVSPIIYDEVKNNDGAEGFLVKIKGKWGVLMNDLKTLILIDKELYWKYATLSYLRLIGITDKSGKFLGYVDFKGKKYWR